MTRKETKSTLKLCSSGADANCLKCAYKDKGCFRAVMRDGFRLIGWLEANEKLASPPKRKAVHGKR